MLSLCSCHCRPLPHPYISWALTPPFCAVLALSIHQDPVALIKAIETLEPTAGACSATHPGSTEVPFLFLLSISSPCF
jgi:hypothetical protein